MAYQKHTWECGDAITPERLNHMEEGIANAGSGGGSGDAGYSCQEVDSEPIITSESVTTVAATQGIAVGQLSESIDASIFPKISVTFNGTTYEVEAEEHGIYGDVTSIGEPVFDRYPFAISKKMIATENPGTYTISIVGVYYEPTVTACFSEAVKTVVGQGLHTRIVTYSISKEITVSARSMEQINLIPNGDTIPGEIIYRALESVHVGLNRPQLIFRGVSAGEGTVNLYVYNASDSDVTITTSDNDIRVGMMFLCLE